MIVVESIGLVFLVVRSVRLMIVTLFGCFMQNGKHGKAWGIVHKEGECISLLLMFILILVS